MRITINDIVFFHEWFPLSADDLTDRLLEMKLAIDDVRKIGIQGDIVEIPWGTFFKKFNNLQVVSVVASERIKLDCYSFEGSSIESALFQSPEILLNDGVFCNATNLKYVCFQGKIISIHHGDIIPELTFKDCTNLVHVDGTFFGSSIWPFAFGNCKSLKQPIDLYVKEISANAFVGCEDLEKLHLHNGLKDLGANSFADCKRLEDIYIPDSVTHICSGAFKNCTSLKKIHLPNQLRSIEDCVFQNCIVLKKVFLSDSIESIGDCAFEGCQSLEKPWLPDKLVKIGAHAFFGCKSIREVFIPDRVVEIGNEAFSECPNLLMKGKKDSFAEQYAIENNIPFLKDQ